MFCLSFRGKGGLRLNTVAFPLQSGMSIAHWLVILSYIVALTGCAGYMRDTIQGRTKPNRASWFLWTLAPVLSFCTALAAHANIWSVAIIVLSGLVCGLIFLASLVNRQSYWKLDQWDILCGLCSLSALGFWLVLHDPIVGLILAIAADAFASIPTLRKAWTHPETETGWTFITGFTSTVLCIPATTAWDLPNFGFTVYLLVINGLLIAFCFRKRVFPGMVPEV